MLMSTEPLAHVLERARVREAAHSQHRLDWLRRLSGPTTIAALTTEREVNLTRQAARALQVDLPFLGQAHPVPRGQI